MYALSGFLSRFKKWINVEGVQVVANGEHPSRLTQWLRAVFLAISRQVGNRFVLPCFTYTKEQERRTGGLCQPLYRMQTKLQETYGSIIYKYLYIERYWVASIITI